MPSPPTHEEQQRLREIVRLAEDHIARTLHRFEEVTQLRVRHIELVRYDSGVYKPTVRIGEPVPSQQA